MLPIKLFRLVSCLFRFNRNIETLCISIEAKQPKKRFVSDSAETSFGSSFGCFESKLVSKDTLLVAISRKKDIMNRLLILFLYFFTLTIAFAFTNFADSHVQAPVNKKNVYQVYFSKFDFVLLTLAILKFAQTR